MDPSFIVFSEWGPRLLPAIKFAMQQCVCVCERVCVSGLAPCDLIFCQLKPQTSVEDEIVIR